MERDTTRLDTAAALRPRTMLGRAMTVPVKEARVENLPSKLPPSNHASDLPPKPSGFVTLDPRKLTLDVVARIRDRADQKTVDVVVHCAASKVYAEPRGLSSALYELLDNAVRASPESHPVMVDVRETREGGVLWQIQDAGEGMSAERLDELGEVRGRARSTHGGGGLGVAFAGAVAEKHGGALQFESALGVGTTASLWLPRSACPELAPDFKALFEAAPALFLVLAPNAPRFTVIATTNAFVRTSGLARSDLLGRGILDLFPEDPADRESIGTVRSSLERVLMAHVPDTLGVQRLRTLSAERKPGEERLFSRWSYPVLGPDGSLAFILHQLEDVTDSVRQEQRYDARFSKFAHEMLQPLNTISGYAQLLARPSTSTNEYIEHIRQASDDLARVTVRLLDGPRDGVSPINDESR